MISEQNRDSFVVGILRETKKDEHRAPLTPDDVAWLKKRLIQTEVQSSRQRIFSDHAYKKAGAKIVKNFQDAALLVGIKEPKVPDMCSDKIYMIFSHTIKGQKQNLPLLRTCLKENVTLIDYECITSDEDKRLAYFGRFAGICGAIDALSVLGRKLKSRRIKTPLANIKPAYQYKDYDQAQRELRKIGADIQKRGFDQRLSPFVIGITGRGNVGQGVFEVIRLLRPLEIHPADAEDFVRRQNWNNKRVYGIVFDREEKLRRKDGKGFYFEDYLEQPQQYESNMDRFLPHINILIHTSYWDKRFPRLVPKRMLNELYNDVFRLELIADISCDMNGSIEITHETTSKARSSFTYSPVTKSSKDGYASKGITVLAMDNLPSEMPKDATIEFSGQIREHIYQVAAHGVLDVTNHVAIPKELRRAVITQGKKLAKDYRYLEKFL